MRREAGIDGEDELGRMVVELVDLLPDAPVSSAELDALELLLGSELRKLFSN